MRARAIFGGGAGAQGETCEFGLSRGRFTLWGCAEALAGARGSLQREPARRREAPALDELEADSI